MAQHYNLEQQEQLATLKAFWDKWGTPIAIVAFALAIGLAGWNGWRYWQGRQAAQAAILLDQLNVSAASNNRTAAEQNFTVLRNQYAKTAQASQAGLRLAKFQAEQKEWDTALETLQWVSSQSRDVGLRALAVLHSSAILMEQDKPDAALSALQQYSFPAEFHALRDDRIGDILQQQGKTAEAVAAYQQAHRALTDTSAYRPLVEFKLQALGQAPTPSSTSASGTLQR